MIVNFGIHNTYYIIKWVSKSGKSSGMRTYYDGEYNKMVEFYNECKTTNHVQVTKYTSEVLDLDKPVKYNPFGRM